MPQTAVKLHLLFTTIWLILINRLKGVPVLRYFGGIAMHRNHIHLWRNRPSGWRAALPWLSSLVVLLCLANIGYAQPGNTDNSQFTFDAFVLAPGENPADKITKNLFVKLVISKSKCYEGEALTAEYRLYTRANVNAQVNDRPGFKGFSSIELPSSTPAGSFLYERLGQKVFKVYCLRRVQLTPLQSGTLTLDPFSIEAEVTFFKASNTGEVPTPENFSPENIITRHAVVANEMMQVEVMPLPANGKPALAEPPVGTFSIAANLQQPEQKSGQTNYLEITIAGKGQWSNITCPAVEWPAGFTTFDPIVEEHLDSQAVPVEGSRSYKIGFETSTTGSLELQPVALTFFDPAKAQYITVATAPLPLKLQANTVAPQAEKTVQNSAGEKVSFIYQFTQWAPIILACAACVLLFYLLRQRLLRFKRLKPEQTQPASSFDKPEATAGITSKKYDSAKAAMITHHVPEQVPVEIDPNIAKDLSLQYKKNILHALQLQLGISASTDVPLYFILMEKGMPAQTTDVITRLLKDCEMLQYAPMPEGFDLEHFAARYYEVLHKIGNT